MKLIKYVLLMGSLLAILITAAYANERHNKQEGNASDSSNPRYGPTSRSGASSSNTSSSTGQYVTDSGITVAVKAKLLAEPEVKSTDISVTTNNGVVSLTGSVETEAQKNRVASLVREVDGVKSVRNELTINSDMD